MQLQLKLKERLDKFRHHPKVAHYAHTMHDPLHCVYFGAAFLHWEELYAWSAGILIIVTLLLLAFKAAD